MLYTNSQLKSEDLDHEIAIGRYLYKYMNQRKDFLRLKPHEKDYIFGWMQVIYHNETHAFDLYEDPYAQEYIFFNIILIYGEDVDKFAGRLYGPSGELTEEQINKDHIFFNKYLQIWKKQIEQHKGVYLAVISPMLHQKLKELKSICSSDDEYIVRERYCYGVFFYIYYKAKLYFGDNKYKCLIFNIIKYDFVINIYTFCHIFSRHYVPSLNRGLPNTMNDSIKYIDINNFAESLRDLIVLYFTHNKDLTLSTEYLLFKFNGEPYIIWIKYKKMDELKKREGFEVRSFYKCESDTDLSRFIGTKEIKLKEECTCCI